MLCKSSTFNSAAGSRCARVVPSNGCVRDVTCFAGDKGSSRDQSPLESLPPALANKFRRAQQKKSQTESSREPLAHEQQTSTPGGASKSARTLADVWQVRSSESVSESSSVVADRGLLDELQKVGTNLSSSVSARPGADKALNSSGSGPQSFLDAVRNNTTVSNPESSAASGYSSVRTEDEEIRATRQQRMQQQGLDGSGNTGWRTGDGSDGSLSEATSFSELLANDSETQAGTDGKRNLSAEQFTLQKQERERERGANVISSDSDYKPSVGTWGIYERPKDISKAYGGGRNITPEDNTITAEEQAEFDASLQEQLANFRRMSGLDVDPAVEAECERLTDQGKILLNRGNLQGALVIFDEAASLLSSKTNAGGAAHLQKAITLDSLGKNQEALKIYRQLRGHRCIEVAKMAKTMSYGFKAGEFLKADKFSYAAKKEEYDPFFTSLGGKWGWNTVYVASDEEKKAEKQINALLVVAATLLAIAPLGAFYYLWYYQC